MSIDRRYDCLIFDLFGVVIAFDDSLVYTRLAPYCTNPATSLMAMRDLVSDPRLIRGKRDLEAVRNELAGSLGLNLSAAQFRAMWCEPYSEPMPGMKDLLRLLSESYRLVLLSNVDRYYWEVMRHNHSELDYFSTYLLSWEQGVAKPEPEAFRRAIAVSNTEASRCLLVDDKAENIEAAQRSGIFGHLFTGVETLQLALAE
jgi:HAD superfamily hydrolase (TIGR01509 family)